MPSPNGAGTTERPLERRDVPHVLAIKRDEKLWALTEKGPRQVRADRLASQVDETGWAKTSGGWSAPKVAQALDVAESSVYRIKRRFAEDVLDLYAEPYNPAKPVVCCDETSAQLLADTRPPILAKPGRPRRVDYEYVRGGTRNLFLSLEPLAGWRHVEITERRTKVDFAHQMRWLVKEAYPEAEVIRVGQDRRPWTGPTATT